MKTDDHIIIIGAGIIGLSIAWRAQEQNLPVTILDAGVPGVGASSVAAGMLAPVTEAAYGEQELLRINLRSAAQYPDFLARLSAEGGEQIELCGQGTLFVALDRDQLEALRRLFEFQISLGLKVEWLDPTATRKLEPGLHPSTRGSILAPDDRAVDPRQISTALRRSIQSAGPSILRDGKVASICPGGTPGVKLTSGEFLSARQVVVSAGCWSGQIEGVPNFVADAVRPVKGQILRLRPTALAPTPAIQHVIRTDQVYLVPRPDGEIVVGATVEERGFDMTLTAGAVFELLRAAEETLPGIREMELSQCAVGLRPGTPDNGPMLGTAGDGLVIATGHYRNGVLLAPITADTISTLLATGETPEEIQAFSPARFK